MLSCTTDRYDILYARWLENPGALLDWGSFDPGKHRLLDLCGGTGAVSLEALRRGAKTVWLYDLNPRAPKDQRIISVRGQAEHLDWNSLTIGCSWDFVVCRQAIGYLDLDATSRALGASVERGGVFVCNAFVRPKWAVRRYEFGGRRYLEASGFFGRRVFHLQAMRTGFDITAFRWYSGGEIVDAFSPWFSVGKIDQTSTSMRFLFRRR